jgi:hypothetical protein
MADNSVPVNPLTIGQSQATTWNPSTVAAKNAADNAINESQAAYKAWAAAGKPESGPEKEAVISAQNATTKAQEAAINAINNDPQDTPVAPPNAGDLAREDAPTRAPTSSGVGAGTTGNAATSKGAEDTPGPNNASTQQALAVFSTSNPNQLIPTQPNQLDQYASYTYSIGWYVLSEAQFKAIAKTQQANVTGWQLLMQSGGAPIAGRSPAFSVDYYLDDLEISSKIWGGGKNAANNAVDIKFRVTEPNGITLIQSLFNAVKMVYNATPTTNSASTGKAPNYLTAQYCLVIQFYGYDANGKLVAPAKGTYSTSGDYGQTAVITKYYPFTVTDIKFTVANKAIEYSIFGKPIPMQYNSSTDRGTIPHAFTMTGQTVNQLLNGKQITVDNTAPDGRNTKPTPPPKPVLVKDLPMQQQAAIAAGTDPNAVNPEGMAFGPGGLSGA